MLAHGLIGAPDKAEISELLRSGESNAEIAQWLSRAYPDIIETMELETGDTADYRTMTGRHRVGSAGCRREAAGYAVLPLG